MIPGPFSLGSCKSCKYDIVALLQFSVDLQCLFSAVVSLVEDVVVSGEKHIKPALCQICGVTLRCAETWVAAVWFAGKSVFHICNGYVGFPYIIFNELEICAEVVRTVFLSCFCNLCFMHHHVSHYAYSYGV